MNYNQVVGALVHLSGELQFISNTGGEESALHLLSFAQLVLNRGLNITFEGNSGRFDFYTVTIRSKFLKKFLKLHCILFQIWCEYSC